MPEKVYTYKAPLGVMVLIIFIIIVAEIIFIPLAQNTTRPWRIEGFNLSPSDARTFFWFAAEASFAFFSLFLVYCIYTQFVGKIRLLADRIIAPANQLFIGTAEIPYSSIKHINITTKIFKPRSYSTERRFRTLNIFHDRGHTTITEGLLPKPTCLDEIHAFLLAQQFPKTNQPQMPSPAHWDRL